MQKVLRVVTHVAPHLDELFAYWLLQHFGEDMFPGVSKAPLEYWAHDMGEISAEAHLESGTLLLGVGGGAFDEHATPESGRKQGHSATTLVASALGVMEHEALARMINFVLEDDLKGGSGPYDLGQLVIAMNRAYPDDPQRVLDWSLAAIDVLLSAQLRMFAVTRPEFEANATTLSVSYNDRDITIAFVESDDPQMSLYARMKTGGGAKLAVLRSSSGHTTIITDRRAGIRLAELARVLRVAEMRENDPDCVLPHYGALDVEGEIPEVPEWYYFKSGEMLFNGSLTHPDVPVSRLSFERLQELIIMTLSTGSFEPSHQETCLTDRCTNRINPCSWYDYSLRRCAAVRQREHAPRK